MFHLFGQYERPKTKIKQRKMLYYFVPRERIHTYTRMASSASILTVYCLLFGRIHEIVVVHNTRYEYTMKQSNNNTRISYWYVENTCWERERAKVILSFSVCVRLFSLLISIAVSFTHVGILIVKAIRLAFTDARSLNSLWVLVCWVSLARFCGEFDGMANRLPSNGFFRNSFLALSTRHRRKTDFVVKFS